MDSMLNIVMLSYCIFSATANLPLRYDVYAFLVFIVVAFLDIWFTLSVWNCKLCCMEVDQYFCDTKCPGCSKYFTLDE